LGSLLRTLDALCQRLPGENTEKAFDRPRVGGAVPRILLDRFLKVQDGFLELSLGLQSLVLRA